VTTAAAPSAPITVHTPKQQPSTHWRGKDLLSLASLRPDDLRSLLARTHHYAQIANEPSTSTGDLRGRAVATMFFEDSTRTRTSFALAARRLGADVVDFSTASSSVNKGETLIDTALAVEAMGISAMVVRTRQSGGAASIAQAVRCPVINAGDGRHEHPTQGLLDAYTIARAHGRTADFDLSGLTVAIVGDIASSRVARSAIAALKPLGARVVCVGSPALAPSGLVSLGCEVTREFDPLLPQADAVMMLRIQFERHGEGAAAPGKGEAPRSASIPSIREYREFYGMTADRAARLKPGAIVMHPGPMNRGLEIDGEVAGGARSAVLRQVAHGVAARMAVLASICC
jgi:aspartate carbamoyltransferase catalytic subunit